MKIATTTEWKKCSREVIDDKVTILQEDAEWLKELIGNIRNTDNAQIIRDAEKDFHHEMRERYGGSIAGALLQFLWEKTKKEEEVW